MPGQVKCFVAYSSESPASVESIEEAIVKIKNGNVVDIKSWKSTNVGGRFIITSICEAIEQNDLFICDLTTLNHNVLFELGFAMAKNKRIWILLNTSIQNAKIRYEKFKLLTTIGYADFANSIDIQTKFYQDQPYSDLHHTIYRETIYSVIQKHRAPTLLYLKAGWKTEASIKLSSKIDSYKDLPVIIDDPKEVEVETITWYAQEVNRAFAVIVHFLSFEHEGWSFYNAKNAFIAGLAYGFGKHLLMLAHEPYSSPIDYRELLRSHDKGERCASIASDWLNNISQTYKKFLSETKKYEKKVQISADLQTVWIGDSIAENESEELLKYFVPTASYYEALTARKSIFIGRRGTGKTAMLYKLAYTLHSNSRNYVCIIKPVDYELEGILRMLQLTMPKAEKGFLIESFWKFLIYTEIAGSVYEKIIAKPAYYQMETEENELRRFVEENESLIKASFSVRLETIVKKLQYIESSGTVEKDRLKISELLHRDIIVKLRAILGRILEKKDKVVVIIDNLDKAWGKRDDLSSLAELLFGLLNVTNSIANDFEKTNHWRNAVNLSLIIFLRSDIFALIKKYNREADKIFYSRISWDDPSLLIQIIEQRFFAAISLSKPEAMWRRFFCSKIGDLSTKDYLVRSILPRPRDLIIITQAAIAQAVNRGHTKVDKDDIYEAEKIYSQAALNSLVSEESTIPIENLLYEFIGKEAIISENDILQAVNRCGLPVDKMEDIIELLCDMTFLGMEVDENRFEFLYNDENKAKFRAMAKKTIETRTNKSARYCINIPFHAYLEIKSSSPRSKQ